MAKINPIKVRQEAERLERTGKIEQALSAYAQLAEDNPRDWNLVNKMGDLYSRLGRVKEACTHYARVAHHLATEGFHLKAIAIWKKINKLDPAALEPYLSLADLYVKQGLIIDAKTHYQLVVEEQLKKGRARDAGEVLRRLIDLDPSDLKARSRLADLYHRDGDTAKAADELVAIADELLRTGHPHEALQVLDKGLKMDPKSARMRVELGKIHLALKDADAAGRFLEEAGRNAPDDPMVLQTLGDAYLAMGRVDLAEGVLRRLLMLQPQDEATRAQYAQLLATKGQFDQAYEELMPIVESLIEKRGAATAASMLERLSEKNPRHTKTLVKLAEIYRQLHRDAQVSNTYAKLVEAYIAEGQVEQALSVMELLVSREPANAAYLERLQQIRALAGQAPAVAKPSRPKPARAAPERDFDLSLDEAAPQPAEEAPPRIVPSGALSEEDKELIAEYLSEGRVFRKYGLLDKAVGQFEALISRFPDNAEARTELRDVFRQQGRLDRAADQLAALAEIARLNGDNPAARAFEEEARSLRGVQEPEPVAESATIGRAGTIASEEEVALAVTSEEELTFEEDALDLQRPEAMPAQVIEPETEPAPEAFVPPVEEALALSEAAELPPAAEAEDEIALAAEAEPTIAAEAPSEALLEDQGVAEPLAPEPVWSEAAPEGDLVLAPEPSEPETPAELASILSEADSFIALGFPDDARELLHRAEQQFPGHPAIASKRAEASLGGEWAAAEPAFPAPATVEPEPAALAPEPTVAEAVDLTPEREPSSLEPVEVAAGPRAAAGEEGPIDLGAELNELFAPHGVVIEPPVEVSPQLGEAGLAEIFREFRRGVDEQLDTEDYDTRYNLGIAYKEMGLIDEAVAEFQLAAKDPRRVLECSSMLGICFLEKGQPKQAIEWFEKGLGVAGRAPDEYRGLKYDLASAYEADGQKSQALDLFTALLAEDAKFRDVAKRVAQLHGSRR